MVLFTKDGGEGLSPNNQARAASQPSLIVWRDYYTIGSAIHHLLVYLDYLNLVIDKEKDEWQY